MAIDCASGSHPQALAPHAHKNLLATAATNGSSVPPTAFIDFHPFSAKKDQSEFDLVAVRVVRRKRSFQGSRCACALVHKDIAHDCVRVCARVRRLTELGFALCASPPAAQRGMAGGRG